jgi:flagellar motility protein MotE (MotC chaperone)
MPDETLEQEIAELTARIATAEEKLRAAEMQRLQDQRKELLEALERRRTDV